MRPRPPIHEVDPSTVVPEEKGADDQEGEGPLWPAPRYWKAMARQRIAAKTWPGGDLLAGRGRLLDFANYLGIAQSTLSMVLNQDQPTSRLVPRISEALGLPLPAPAAETELLNDLYAMLAEMSEDQQAGLREHLRSLIQPSPRR